MEKIKEKIQKLIDGGFAAEVNAACKYAQNETRAFIARTHPHTAFGGKTLDDKQFVAGFFDIAAEKVKTSIYATYFARWYNTGAFGRVIRYGSYRGRKATKYPPRGNYFESNAKAIEEYYLRCVDRYLQRSLDKWLPQK